MGIGDWAQSPIPNPLSPIKISLRINLKYFLIFIKLEFINKQKNKLNDVELYIHINYYYYSLIDINIESPFLIPFSRRLLYKSKYIFPLLFKSIISAFFGAHKLLF